MPFSTQEEKISRWKFIMAVLYISRRKAIMFYGCTLFFFFFSKGHIRGY